MFEVMEKSLKNRCSANTPGKIYINDLHDIKSNTNTIQNIGRNLDPLVSIS